MGPRAAGVQIRLLGAGAFPPAERRRIARAVRAALGRLARRRAELCVVFVGDAEIRRLNRLHLGHDYATDVIAFPSGSPPPGSSGPRSALGDIVVSRDTARRQARELGHALRVELLTLAVHGALHLAGYDDLKPAAKRRMFARQDRIVRAALAG